MEFLSFVQGREHCLVAYLSVLIDWKSMGAYLGHDKSLYLAIIQDKVKLAAV